MAVSQERANSKESGARYNDYRKEKQFNLGREPALTKLGAQKRREVRGLGGNKKLKSLVEEIANVYDPKAKTYKKVKIKNITENSANRNFIRRNIITKGAVVDTELGKAKVTSRPGQVGYINAILVK